MDTKPSSGISGKAYFLGMNKRASNPYVEEASGGEPSRTIGTGRAH